MTTTYEFAEGIKSQSVVTLISHTVTADEATANQAVLSEPEALSITGALVQILRSGVDVKSDAIVTFSGGDMTVADGASTYDMTAGDVIEALAFGNAG